MPDDKRSTYGSGSIYPKRNRRGETVYVAVLSIDSKRVYRTRSTEELAKRELRKLRSLREKGQLPPAERTTLAAHLDTWLTHHKTRVRYGSYLAYEQAVRLHISPLIGKLRLAAVQARHLRDLYAALSAGGLAPQTVRRVHGVLHLALRQAERDGLIPRNVVDLVSPPRTTRYEAQTLSAAQARTLLAAVRDTDVEPFYVLALTTGMREGELLGLRWQAVDLAAGQLAVRYSLSHHPHRGPQLEETKTARSRRPLLLTRQAVDALKRHRARQHAARLQAGVAWDDGDYVLCDRVGLPLNKMTMIRRHHRLLARLDLPRVRVHDLRHSTATLLLEMGIHPVVVAAILGHASTKLTTDTYSHVTPTIMQEAMRAMERLFSEQDGGEQAARG